MKDVKQLEIPEGTTDSNDFLRENWEGFYTVAGMIFVGDDDHSDYRPRFPHPDNEYPGGIVGIKDGYVFSDWALLTGGRWAILDHNETMWGQFQYVGQQPDRVLIEPGTGAKSFSKSGVIPEWTLFELNLWEDIGVTVLTETKHRISIYSLKPYKGINVIPCV